MYAVDSTRLTACYINTKVQKFSQVHKLTECKTTEYQIAIISRQHYKIYLTLVLLFYFYAHVLRLYWG